MKKSSLQSHGRGTRRETRNMRKRQVWSPSELAEWTCLPGGVVPMEREGTFLKRLEPTCCVLFSFFGLSGRMVFRSTRQQALSTLAKLGFAHTILFGHSKLSLMEKSIFLKFQRTKHTELDERLIWCGLFKNDKISQRAKQ